MALDLLLWKARGSQMAPGALESGTTGMVRRTPRENRPDMTPDSWVVVGSWVLVLQ